jgi:hypothetical protein
MTQYRMSAIYDGYDVTYNSGELRPNGMGYKTWIDADTDAEAIAVFKKWLSEQKNPFGGLDAKPHTLVMTRRKPEDDSDFDVAEHLRVMPWREVDIDRG